MRDGALEVERGWLRLLPSTPAADGGVVGGLGLIGADSKISLWIDMIGGSDTDSQLLDPSGCGRHPRPRVPHKVLFAR